MPNFIFFASPSLIAAVLLLFIATPTTAVRVWKWVLGITSAINALLLSPLLFPSSLEGMGMGGLIFLAPIVGGNALIGFEILCLLIAIGLEKWRRVNASRLP